MYLFKEIVGHDEVKNHFQSAMKLNKVSHAYIIEGEEGLGKRLMAQTFAKTLQCEAKGEEACDVCQSCRLFDTNNHPDVKHIIATKKTGIGVDDIREQVNKDVHIKPYMFDYKVYIIHEAEKMTVQAQNALLKTIEEPPSYVRFLLLATYTHSFLPTVLSRCVLVKLKPISDVMIRRYLDQVMHVPDYQAKVYSAFARGNIGRALSLKDSESFKEMREALIGVMKVVASGSKYKVIDQVEVFEKYGPQKKQFLDLMLTWLRDLMVIKSVGEEGYLIHADQKNQLLKQAPHVSYNRISTLIDGIQQIMRYDRLHINYTLLTEVMLINAMNIHEHK